jgi:hypothetical protein
MSGEPGQRQAFSRMTPMVDLDAYQQGTTDTRTEFTANDFRIKRALESIVRSATEIKGDVVLAEDILARIQSLQHMLKQVGHTI